MALSVYTPTGIVHETSVDFTKRVLTEPVHLVQYDESLPVVAVTCLDAGQYMTLTALDTVSIRMDKGDGTFIYNPALGMSADGHIVYIQITLQMTANYGRFEPVIELLRDGGYGASSPIPLFIDANPVPNSAIESTNEFQTVQSMYNTVVGFSGALDYLNTPQAQTDVANAEENATSAAASASAAATSESNAADSEASAAASAAEAHAIVDSSTITFTEAAIRDNIVSGESISTLFGKVKKWFTDLGSIVNNLGEQYVATYQPNLTPINMDTSAEITSVPADTTMWLLFPITREGCTMAGILGYTLGSSVGTGSYSWINLYSLQPHVRGVYLACATDSHGSWDSPRCSFTILWRKTV